MIRPASQRKTSRLGTKSAESMLAEGRAENHTDSPARSCTDIKDLCGQIFCRKENARIFRRALTEPCEQRRAVPGVGRASVITAVILPMLFVFFGCRDSDSVPGHVVIRNDILDKEFNSFTVDNVVTKRGMTNFHAVLRPHRKIVIPQQNIMSMRFMRRYADHTKIYHVKCPPDEDQTTVMRLIDVHTNRLCCGCKLTKRGQLDSDGVTRWEK